MPEEQDLREDPAGGCLVSRCFLLATGAKRRKFFRGSQLLHVLCNVAPNDFTAHATGRQNSRFVICEFARLAERIAIVATTRTGMRDLAIGNNCLLAFRVEALVSSAIGF